jgi:hypothetical protein
MHTALVQGAKGKPHREPPLHTPCILRDPTCDTNGILTHFIPSENITRLDFSLQLDFSAKGRYLFWCM